MDWGTAAILAAIVALEGLRRVPPNTLVLRRSLVASWAIADDRGWGGRWRLVSWLPPLWTTLVLARRGTPTASRGDPAARLAQTRPWRTTLDILGGAVLAALLAGVPFATARATGTGVALAIGLVAGLAVATTAVSAVARARLGLPRAAAFAALSPFAAPYAAERLLEHALAETSPVGAAQALLAPEQFRAWIRPRVYDATTVQTPDDEVAALDCEARAAILAAPPRPDDATCYCPRCGAVYQRAETCADCQGIPLQRYEAVGRD